MINSNNRPSRLRKALALPALLAVVALACSKDQGSPRASVIPDKPLQLKFANFNHLMRDSVKINLVGKGGQKIKVIHFDRLVLKDSIRLNFEPTGQKRSPDDVITVRGMEITSDKDNDSPPPPNR